MLVSLHSSILLQVVVELLDPDSGQLIQFDVTQLGDDVVLDVVQVIVFRFLSKPWFSIYLIPHLHPAFHRMGTASIHVQPLTVRDGFLQLYFSITGRANTGYCNRPFDSRGRTCKEVGAIAQWTLSKKDDDVFKDYRREYKKRFARMKAGTLPSQEFYAWSKKAREKKAACEAGEITVDKFKAWLEMT